MAGKRFSRLAIRRLSSHQGTSLLLIRFFFFFKPRWLARFCLSLALEAVGGLPLPLINVFLDGYKATSYLVSTAPRRASLRTMCSTTVFHAPSGVLIARPRGWSEMWLTTAGSCLLAATCCRTVVRAEENKLVSRCCLGCHEGSDKLITGNSSRALDITSSIPSCRRQAAQTTPSRALGKTLARTCGCRVDRRLVLRPDSLSLIKIKRINCSTVTPELLSRLRRPHSPESGIRPATPRC